MEKRYLYLVFLTLSGGVVLMLALLLKFAKVPHSSNISTYQSTQSNIDLYSSLGEYNYNDSWIAKFSQEQSQKEYHYPVQQFHIEFN
ncbi:MAG: hypothetical protein K0U47_00250 [Epsilonproteobacteria bacterium]|nr:hypothetical protein [Campylobacterota bacterium]